MFLDRDEVASILAGLRLLECARRGETPVMPAVLAIADDCGELRPLSPEGIESLCERINMSETIEVLG